VDFENDRVRQGAGVGGNNDAVGIGSSFGSVRLRSGRFAPRLVAAVRHRRARDRRNASSRPPKTRNQKGTGRNPDGSTSVTS
jgi:hypothetical protein